MIRPCLLLVLSMLPLMIVTGFTVVPFFVASPVLFSSARRPISNVPPEAKTRKQQSTIELWSSREDGDEEDDFVRVPRSRRRGRFFKEEVGDDAFYEEVERRIYGEEKGFSEEEKEDWEEEDDDEEEDEDEDLGLFSNVLIDNPILDSIDPDGAAERFPELARDPRFWFDMLLFITFLDLLSAIGPQDYFPDIPYYV